MANLDFYKDYNFVQGDPLGLGVHFPRQQARVNVNMFVARLAEEVGHTAFLGAFTAHRQDAMTLLGLVVYGTSAQPEEFTDVAAQIAQHAPQRTKHCPWPTPGGSWEPPQEKWEKHKNMWGALTHHEIPGVQELAWETYSQMCIVDIFDSEGPEQITH
ncbi:hypothetical protein Forpe1208_v008022 [Fusarium oxysporum f. sp. rapae]|uniref:Uncharacterized protein n=1 Tax=Fusarium oxysporum f. sp. rapae TaxID=485398 RepID=A0A8J5TST2_FUSOX|nr:hypothetical protein Forpe1208_v008022 [Fusarium oxysporum f. sp. rapae]